MGERFDDTDAMFRRVRVERRERPRPGVRAEGWYDVWVQPRPRPERADGRESHLLGCDMSGGRWVAVARVWPTDDRHGRWGWSLIGPGVRVLHAGAHNGVVASESDAKAAAVATLERGGWVDNEADAGWNGSHDA